MLNIDDFWKCEFDEHLSLLSATRQNLQNNFEQMLTACKNSLSHGGKIIFCGNGGSAADSQHLATELTVRYKKNRKAMAAVALTTDTSALTAIGNDFGFDFLFARQLEALGQSGDILIAISTSGNSPNIIKTLEMADEIGNIIKIGFTGKTGGKMANMCDILINVPSIITARIQEMHILLGHMLCDALENEME